MDAKTEFPPRGFLANLTTVLGGQAASVAAALAAEICFARLLGPAARGQISLCMMAIYLGTLVGGLGADIPIVTWVAGRKKDISDWLPAVLSWGLLGCSLAEFLCWSVYSRWHASLLRGVTPSLFSVILMSIPFTVLFNYLLAFLTGAERFRERAGIGLLEGIASLISFLVLVWVAGRSADSAMWGNLAGLILGLVIGLALLRRVFEGGWKFSGDAKLRAGLLAGLRGQIGNVAAFFNYRLDVFIVNYFLDPAQVGLYAVGVAASEALWQIPQAAATTLFPRTARTLEEGGEEFTCLILRQVLLLSCVSGAALALASPFAVPLIFGARFQPSVAVIWWILPGTVALALGKVAASDLAGRHKTGYASVFGIISLLVTVALDLLLIPRMGISGAALASSAAYFTNGILLLIALKKELSVKWATFFVPSREELLQYKSAWNSLLLKTRTSDWNR